MNYNAYQFLGLTSSATKEEVEQKYNQLKAQYQKDRFLPGEEGNLAAENLERLEIAYRDIMADFEDKQAEQDFGSIYGQIADYIKKDDLSKAQQLLDECSTRDGEWHYLQSIVFYKNNWFLESKKQLELACQMDPSNARYKQSLEKLNKILASNTISPDQMRTNSSYTTSDPQMGAGNGSCTGSHCLDCMMCNMCCNCMQCMGGCR